MGFRRRKSLFFLLTAVVILLLFLAIPLPRFPDDYATLVLSENGNMLGARVSRDEQWRFEPIDSIPDNFRQALIAFEDRFFYRHPGVNPQSVFRALVQNLSKGKVVSGGSTLTMQVARLSRPGSERTVFNKLVEVVLALRMEFSLTKEEILSLYVTHAPFGGNVVGLEAASWKYFNRSPYDLSWGEAATLAVLPNAPSLIYPGKGNRLLMEKRNRLLQKLYKLSVIDSITYELSVDEPVPSTANIFPDYAPHLVELLRTDKSRHHIKSTIDFQLQLSVNRIVDDFYDVYSAAGIHNMAVLVVDVPRMSVSAYVGNAGGAGEHEGQYVDIIQSRRSSGSILKPFLYAAALSDGTIMPRSLLPDVPMYINGFTPRNFNLSYAGLVPANEALVRSLNIPFVDLLSAYGTERFRGDLENMGFTGFNKPASHYGLSMILGGGEVSLWELARAYASMAGFVSGDEPIMQIRNPQIVAGEKEQNLVSKAGFIRKGSAYITFQNLTELSRPDEETGWHYFNSSSPVAWKTGTSFGFRDAWAVGVTPDNVVAVWVGNASGYGVNGLTGTQKAAPVMFRVLSMLDYRNRFFNEPWNDLTYAKVCDKSGFTATSHCENIRDELVPANVAFNQSCVYHQLVHLSSDEKFRVNGNCYPVSKMVHKKWFVVAPRYAAFFSKSNAGYTELPPYKPGCEQTGVLQFIYPDRPVKIYQPRDFGGVKMPVVLEAVHENSNAVIRWFDGDNYIGSTHNIHQMSVVFETGVHTITITDTSGNESSVVITVLDEETKKPPNP